MELIQIINELGSIGLLTAANTRAEPLSGGVSSDIWLLDDGQQQLVVKQALAQLRVTSEWKADVGRNAVEHRYLTFVERMLPHAVPKVRYVSDHGHFFAMEYLAAFQTWKRSLLAGVADSAVARQVGSVLGTIHHRTWERDDVRTQFDTTPWFDQLRLDPYLRALAVAHPQLVGMLHAEVDRIANTRLCLVHGDFCPKNLMIAPGRVVVVDCEVAWFGDPTFDVAFLLNHLMLKAIHLPDHSGTMLKLVRSAWGGYVDALGSDHSVRVMAGLPRLILLLMLARIDGKSPVEYIVDPAVKHRVRRFVIEQLLDVLPSDLEALLTSWSSNTQANIHDPDTKS